MRILVVKGSNPLAREVRRGSGEDDVEIDLVSCPQAAEQMARGANYDTIILDLKIVLRAGGSDALGEVGALTDPAEVEELISRLTPLLSMRQRRMMVQEVSEQEVLRVHDLELLPSARCAKRGGEPLELTSREYDVLEMLVRNKGRMLSHRAIRTAIWGNEEMHPSILGTYIRRVRDKVDRGHSLPLILTRWGRGYMVRGDG